MNQHQKIAIENNFYIKSIDKTINVRYKNVNIDNDNCIGNIDFIHSKLSKDIVAVKDIIDNYENVENFWNFMTNNSYIYKLITIETPQKLIKYAKYYDKHCTNLKLKYVDVIHGKHMDDKTISVKNKLIKISGMLSDLSYRQKFRKHFKKERVNFTIAANHSKLVFDHLVVHRSLVSNTYLYFRDLHETDANFVMYMIQLSNGIEKLTNLADEMLLIQ